MHDFDSRHYESNATGNDATTLDKPNASNVGYGTPVLGLPAPLEEEEKEISARMTYQAVPP